MCCAHRKKMPLPLLKALWQSSPCTWIFRHSVSVCVCIYIPPHTHACSFYELQYGEFVQEKGLLWTWQLIRFQSLLDGDAEFGLGQEKPEVWDLWRSPLPFLLNSHTGDHIVCMVCPFLKRARQQEDMNCRTEQTCHLASFVFNINTL